MSDDLPSSYDVVVVGTGLVESIVAAAAARIGKQVLHIDKNKYYGQHWATFNYDDVQQWVGDLGEVPSPTHDPVDNLQFLATEESKRLVSDISQEWFGGVITKPKEPPKKSEVAAEGDAKADEAPVTETLTADETKAKLASLSRKFNIDLAPKLLFFKGPMVDVLIKSQVSRYLEFLGVQNILLCVNGVIELVPCSKSDVFSTRTVTIVEKRLLMKLLTTLQSYKDDSEELKELENTTFEEYLKQQNISETVQHYILYSIAMATQETTAAKGIKQAQAFLNSIGFCGNTPFIWPMYGTSEILQAFCRLSAVYGGIYCLNRNADFLVNVENGPCEGVYSNGGILKAQNVVVSTGLVPSCYVNRESPSECYQRAVLITNKAVFPGGKEGISLLTYPFLDSSFDPITLLELNSNTSSCPKGFFVVHLVSRKGKQKTPYEDFDKLIADIFSPSGEGDKPTILYKLLFTVDIISTTQVTDLPANVHSCSGPRCLSIDFHSSLQEAETIFKRMFPDDEFLPTPEATEEVVSEE
uniref:Rab proteins geranylgeranyltransferase component A n=1 Tax=Lygus hesperus TaxID=30085 RepID=A0A0A9XFE1_LYGHE